MIRKLILLAVLSFSVSNLYSQEKKYEYVDVPDKAADNVHSRHYTRIDVNKIRFGAMVAPTITWMHPTTSTSDDGKYKVSSDGSKFGYMWGLMAEYYFAGNYALVTGFEVNSQGGKINTALANINPGNPANTVLNTHFDYRLQYIEIPVALKLISDELPKNGARIYGQVGLTLAVNISRIATYNVNYFDENGVSQTATGNNQKLTGSLAVPPAMLQLNVGLGVEYPIASKLMFYTGLFFNNGFLPDATNPQNYTLGYKGSFSDGNTRLNNFALRLGLFF